MNHLYNSKRVMPASYELADFTPLWERDSFSDLYYFKGNEGFFE